MAEEHINEQNTVGENNSPTENTKTETGHISLTEEHMTSVMSGTEYDENQIQVLEGLEAVRKRPGMYIGSTSSRGLHHLVYEIVDNSIDEALAGYCTHIEVTIKPGNIIEVSDNGRGIPVDIQPKLGIPAVTVVYTVLHAGGKFGGEDSGYKVAGGLHGVGASVVNALSEWLVVHVRRDGAEYEQSFKRGKPDGDLKKIGVVLKRAKYFITCEGKMMYHMRLEQQFLTRQLTGEEAASNWEVSHPEQYQQLSLFDAAVPGHI